MWCARQPVGRSWLAGDALDSRVRSPPPPRFFGNHSLPGKAVPGLELTFEIWENSQAPLRPGPPRFGSELE